MTKDVKKTIGSYLMLRAISAFGMSLIGATYATFLISKGLNLFEVNLVNFVFWSTLFIFEIPTGAFADIFGRKFSFVLSCCFFSLGMFLYAMAKSFWGFALSECMAAIGSTFASGAFQAWFVDRVRHQGYDGPLGKIFSREQQIKSGMGIVAAILGAFAAEKNSSMPWFLSCYIFAILAIISSLWIKEEEFARKKFSFGEGMRAMREIVKTSTHYTMTNSAVRFIVIMGVAQFFAVQAPNMQWQPFFMEFLKHKSSLGFIFSGISIAMMVGAMLAPRLLRKIGSERAALSAVQTAIGTGICLTIFCRSFFPAVSVFMIHEIFRGMFVPLKDAYLNDNIPSGKRATLISFESISHHLGGMIGLLVSGAIAQYASMQSAWMLSGVVLIASTLTLLKNGRR